MSGTIDNEPMLDMYIFETTQLIGQLEQLMIDGEKTSDFSCSINEIFRIMHTIKGSSAMMLYNNIAELSHAIEDLFYYLREKRPEDVDYNALSDIVLETVDFIKNELAKVESGNQPDGESAEKIEVIKRFLNTLKTTNGNDSLCADEEKKTEDDTQKYFVTSCKKVDGSDIQRYKAVVFFEKGCEMENIRAFAIIHKLSEIADSISHFPENIIEGDPDAIDDIRENGFTIYFNSSLDIISIRGMLEKTVFLRSLELAVQKNEEIILKDQINQDNFPKYDSSIVNNELKSKQVLEGKCSINSPQNHGVISVNISKTDRLMDLIGELVIAEAMVTQNPDLKKLNLNNFQKAARQLNKITNELQDVVMSIRMVPLSTTFFKMQRIVRDMSKKLDKEVSLEVIGEETEVDKNIIDHISDPLMHLVRNSIDHGIESGDDRKANNKQKIGTVTLEARHAGSDVLIIVRDDGKGLNREKILEKARKNGLIHKSENEMTDKEVFNLVFLPGFSTCDTVTEFSGRGVGMDVVRQNIEAIGGTISVDSIENVGTAMTLKIPLTLAIIDGMNIKVGYSYYTIPTISIKESFRPKEKEIIHDSDGNEMIMVRGQCHPIIRLHEIYGVRTDIDQLDQGILIMVEHNEKSLCIFADKLLGQQQVVVKALPNYIKSTKKITGLGGCTILGDGSISLILDIEGLLNK